MPTRGYLDVKPELVFEVRSPSDRWVEMIRKAAEYLNAGVPVVCLVDAERRTILVCDNGDEPHRILGRTDLLTLPQVLPSFEIKVAHLFE